MPPIDVTNPDVIKFLKETYDKTLKLRIKWNIIHKDKLDAAAHFVGKEKGYTDEDVAKSVLEAGMAATARENINAAYYRRHISSATPIPGIKDLKKEHSIINLGLGDPETDPLLARPDDDFSIDPIMRPVPYKQKLLIHKDIPDYGRKEYLRVRYQKNPEDKFYLPECSGWDYGWRLKENYFGRNSPAYPRRYAYNECSISRTGAQPDPPHYKLSNSIKNKSSCTTDST